MLPDPEKDRPAIGFAASFFLRAAVSWPTNSMLILETVLEKKRTKWRGALARKLSSGFAAADPGSHQIADDREELRGTR